MKILFFSLFTISIFSKTLFADFFIDRVSLKTKPDSACTTVFNNAKVIASTCSNMKFETTLQSSENNTYKDYIFFFKTDYPLKSLSEKYASRLNASPSVRAERTNKESQYPLGMVNTYFKENSLLSISEFKPLPQEYVFSLDSQLSSVISENQENLKQELEDIRSSLDKEQADFEKKLKDSFANSAKDRQLTDLIQAIATLTYLENEKIRINELKSRSEKIQTSSDDIENGKMKAQLSTMLKHTIEAALTSK